MLNVTFYFCVTLNENITILHTTHNMPKILENGTFDIKV
jgi:hypothetical protein